MTEVCPLDAAATAAAGRGRSRRDNPVIVMPHLQGSSAMLSLSPSAAVVDTGHYPADLARLTSLPTEPSRLDNFRAAVAGLTGLDAASPRTAEIVSAVVAGITTTMLVEGSSSAAAPADASARACVRGPPAGTFPAPLPGAVSQGGHPPENERPNKAHLTLARPATLPVEGQLCTVFAVDIVGFTRPERDDDIRLYLHQQLYEYLRAAFDDAGVPWAECFCEDRGDGVLMVIPPEISVKGLIDPLPEKLRGLIRRHNHVSAAAQTAAPGGGYHRSAGARRVRFRRHRRQLRVPHAGIAAAEADAGRLRRGTGPGHIRLRVSRSRVPLP